jgi:hypothetical protein
MKFFTSNAWAMLPCFVDIAVKEKENHESGYRSPNINHLHKCNLLISWPTFYFCAFSFIVIMKNPQW